MNNNNARSMVGRKVVLTKSMLGCPAGAIGYVFNQYVDFDEPNRMGVQIIFPNGEYDGFSVQEQNLFLKFEQTVPEYTGYKFSNVLQVLQDFRNGFWKFQEGEQQ